MLAVTGIASAPDEGRGGTAVSAFRGALTPDAPRMATTGRSCLSGWVTSCEGSTPNAPAMRFSQATETVRVPVSNRPTRSEEHTSELQSLMRISYAVFCLKKTIITNNTIDTSSQDTY